MNKILLLDDRNYARRLEDTLKEEQGITVKKFDSNKELYSAVLTEKPQMIMLPAGVAGAYAGRRVLRKYPFIPFVVYGDFGKTVKSANGRIEKFLNSGFSSCLQAHHLLNRDAFMSAINQVLWKGLAKESIWEKERGIAVSESRYNLFRNAMSVFLAALIMAAFGFVYRDKIFINRAIRPVFYKVPYNNLSGAAISGNILWACDWQTQNIYEHSIGSALPIRHVFSFPERRFSGITAGAGHLWTLDSWRKKIYKHIFDERMNIVSEFDTPGPVPSGISFNGKYILTCDNSTGKLYVHKTDEKLTVIKDYTLPDIAPMSIFGDGKYVWVLDAKTNKLYKLVFTDFELSIENVFIVPQFESFKFSSITGDKNYIWLASEKGRMLYRYPKDHLEINQ